MSTKKWNARTVIRRALIVAETLLKGETPRFKLYGDVPYYDDGNYIDFVGDFDTLDDLQSAIPTTTIGNLAWVVNVYNGNGGTYKYTNNGWKIQDGVYPLTEDALFLEKIETPEFQFTKSTLREVLQEVGKFVHAEPRLDNGYIKFDKLGDNEDSEIDIKDYASKGYQQAVDRYATNLHATVNNFVNSINYANGVMVEPYSNGFKTVRTEDLYVKLEDTNIHIATQYPIRSILKLECGIVSGYNGNTHDITPFVYEAAEYQRLSSYEGSYPQSKAWALYYTIGQNGVYGLNFKEKSALFPAFKNYAIINILNAVTGESETLVDMTKLAFRITYEPIYSATVQQNKSYIGDLDKPANLIYNQGQNLIESHYFGENMKGAIARLGNVDSVVTFVKNGLVYPPQTGKVVYDNDDNYKISAVATEIYPFYTKFSLSLSKNFNRYSDYVGVNSEKRMYEISERQAFDSHITYKDYVVIGDIPYSTTYNDGLFDYSKLYSIFYNKSSTDYYIEHAVSLAQMQGFDTNGNALQLVGLPVQKSAIGNSAVFVIKYKDNYSAGDNVVLDNNLLWQNGVSYSDYFGNMEYLDFSLWAYGEEPSDYFEQTKYGNALPLIESGGDLSAEYVKTNQPLWVKKGSTEIPTIDYQVDFVTNRKNIVIGSALAKNFPLVCGYIGEEHNAKMFLLPSKINDFATTIDINNGQEIVFNIIDNSGDFEFKTEETPDKTYKSWAIVDGKTNELLIGCNKTINSNTNIFDGLKMFIKHDIFNKGE